MAFGIPLRPGRLLPILKLAERHGERCGGPVLLSGLILGIGVVELSCGALGQTSRFSLELLTLLVLQVPATLLSADSCRAPVGDCFGLVLGVPNPAAVSSLKLDCVCP